MATTSESGRSSSKTRRGRGTGLSAETILDIVESLGVVDLVTARLRARLEQADMDELLDDLRDYVRRNPEVLVVALAAITVAAGLIVYLDARRDDRAREDEEEVTPRVAASRATPPRSRRSQ